MTAKLIIGRAMTLELDRTVKLPVGTALDIIRGSRDKVGFYYDCLLQHDGQNYAVRVYRHSSHSLQTS